MTSPRTTAPATPQTAAASVQSPLVGWFGRRCEVAFHGECESCGRRELLRSFDAREWIRVGPLAVFPLQAWRVLQECPRCGHWRRLPQADYHAWAVEQIQSEREALDAAPDDLDLRVALAWKCYGLGLHPEALAALAVQVAVDAAPAAVYHVAAVVLRGLGRRRLATDVIHRAVELEPDNALYHFELGRLLLERGTQLPLAEHHLSTAAAELTGDAEVWVQLALARTRAGLGRSAWEAWRHAAELDPHLADEAELQVWIERAGRRAGRT